LNDGGLEGGADDSISWKGRKAYCFRCGHSWTSRLDERPRACPQCRSRRYDSPSDSYRCVSCGFTWSPCSSSDFCPHCGVGILDDNTSVQCTCNQCGHIWISRQKEKPLKCPKCKSRNWSDPKVPQFTCRKCGYVWKSRTDKPKYCPKCKTNAWDSDTFKLKCFRCGYKWVPSEGVDPEAVSTCPSCRSKKWNELPPLRLCFSCKNLFVSQAPGKRCPECSGKEVFRMECGFCGTSWTSDKPGRICPRCGLILSDNEGSEKNTELWNNGEFKLDYLFKDGIGCVYLWKGGYPDSCEYMDVLLGRLNIRYSTLMGRVGDEKHAEFWNGLIDDMHDRRDVYLENIPYLKERLGLDHDDAGILALHFVGMSPEVIALRLGSSNRDIRAAFTRIQNAYRDSDIVVNDSVYTEDPISYYGDERWSQFTT